MTILAPFKFLNLVNSHATNVQMISVIPQLFSQREFLVVEAVLSYNLVGYF